MSTKYFSKRLTVFGLFLIVTIVQGEPRFDSNLSCQQFSRNGVCCPGRDNDCVVYASKHGNSERFKCYCDEHCVTKNYLNQTSCCSDYEQYCKTPVNLDVFTTQSTDQTESPKKVTVDEGIKETTTKKISVSEDDEDLLFFTKLYYQQTKVNEQIKSRLRQNPPNLSFINRKLHNGATNLPDEYVVPAEYSRPVSDKYTGESWAVTASDVLSNRLSMKYDKLVAMSTQQIISCSKSEQPGQLEKQLEDAWTFILQNNMVNESCYPLTDDNNECQINFKTDNLVQCQNSNVFQQTKLYKAGEIYRVINSSDILNNEANIMTEIFKYGSVQATMVVYSDFINYKNGIYYPSPDAEFMGYLPVRIIGWGEESNGKYWLAVNSWGTNWGENGSFKIAKGIQACAIEYYVVGVEV